MSNFSFLPTKANLLRLKQEIKVIKDGYNLLDHKREVLIRELLRFGFEIKDLKENLDESLKNTYDKFSKSKKKMGREKFKFLSILKPAFPKIIALEKSIMGVHIPILSLEEEFEVNFQDPSLSCKEFDEFLVSLKNLVPLLLRYVEVSFSLFRIGRELLKTQKRLKALENFHIPQYSRTIARIESVLEETEREELFRNKKIKMKLEEVYG